MIAQYAPFVMAAILIVAIVQEVKTGRIPNWLTFLPVALFVAVAVTAEDWTAVYWQLGLAGAVFLFGLVLFAFAGIGAGAVKLMAGV
ncbi:MAG: prepilin peptidase, partial [Paracoccaceae bacterium]|nr:prepilin peptidase [Paracoccaceae bacterium]